MRQTQKIVPHHYCGCDLGRFEVALDRARWETWIGSRRAMSRSSFVVPMVEQLARRTAKSTRWGMASAEVDRDYVGF